MCKLQEHVETLWPTLLLTVIMLRGALRQGRVKATIAAIRDSLDEVEPCLRSAEKCVRAVRDVVNVLRGCDNPAEDDAARRDTSQSKHPDSGSSSWSQPN